MIKARRIINFQNITKSSCFIFFINEKLVLKFNN